MRPPPSGCGPAVLRKLASTVTEIMALNGGQNGPGDTGMGPGTMPPAGMSGTGPNDRNDMTGNRE